MSMIEGYSHSLKRCKFDAVKLANMHQGNCNYRITYLFYRGWSRRVSILSDEYNTAIIIEAKITGDDGTARDKLSRIERLTQMRDERRRAGEPAFEVVACIDGRGFGVRRADMRELLRITEGKVFTLATLDQLIPYTRLHEFLPHNQPESQ
jgi:hypothetical protein